MEGEKGVHFLICEDAGIVSDVADFGHKPALADCIADGVALRRCGDRDGAFDRLGGISIYLQRADLG